MTAAEAAVRRLGPGGPVHNVRVLEDCVADASADARFALFVLGAFALLAVILAAVGVYGSSRMRRRDARARSRCGWRWAPTAAASSR